MLTVFTLMITGATYCAVYYANKFDSARREIQRLKELAASPDRFTMSATEEARWLRIIDHE